MTKRTGTSEKSVRRVRVCAGGQVTDHDHIKPLIVELSRLTLQFHTYSLHLFGRDTLVLDSLVELIYHCLADVYPKDALRVWGQLPRNQAWSTTTSQGDAGIR